MVRAPRPRLPLISVLLWAGIAVAGAAANAAGEPPEPVVWLRGYLQIDTTNPPGNERQAAEFLAGILEKEGIASRLLTSPGGRTSLYARLEAPGSGGRAVALVHHLDVVPADGDWQVEPFSGRSRDGRLWGRGAIDIKSLGIAELAAVIDLERSDAPRSRDVVLLAVADEERGGGEGMGWLWQAHPELFAGVEAVLNEGGSNRVLNDQLAWWGIEVTQKRPLWLRVTASGRGGHGSGLNVASATHQLIKALARLLDRPLRYRVTDAARMFLGSLADVEGREDHLYHHLDEIIREDGPTVALAPGLPVYFLDTVQVTEIDNGRGPNVVAPEASAYVDVRLLPDTDADAFLKDVRETLGSNIDVEVILTAPEAPASPVDNPYYRKIEDVLRVRGPVVPIFISGVTDARYFRQRGIPAYGIQPFALNPPDLRGIHGADEQIPVDELLRGIELMRRIVRAWSSP